MNIILQEPILLLNNGLHNCHAPIDFGLQTFPLIRGTISSTGSLLTLNSIPIGMSILSSSSMAISSGGEEERSVARSLESILGRNGVAALLQDVLADGHSVESLLERLGVVLALLSLARLQEVGDDVDPFLVETGHMRLDLVLGVGGDLSLEGGIDAAQDEAQEAFLSLFLQTLFQERSALHNDAGHESGTGDIEIGEVGRVGFVHVEIKFHNGGARVDADGLEDLGAGTGGLFDGGGNEVAMLEEVAVNADLGLSASRSE